MTDEGRASGWRRLGEASANIAIVVFLLYLALRPSGLVGSWWLERAARTEFRAAVGARWEELVGPQQVDSDGRVLVEFLDYQCPACRAMERSLQQAVADGRLVVVRHHFPLAMLHPLAEGAARAVLCAEEIGQGEDLHQVLIHTEDWMQEAGRIMEAAAQAGIADTLSLGECMESEATNTRLQAGVELARELGLRGTPSFVSRGGVIVGGADIEALVSLAAQR